MNEAKSKTRAEWRAMAAALELRTGCLIAGRFQPAVSGATFPSINPADGRVLAEVAAGDQADIDQAVAAARRTFEAGVWRDMPPAGRKKRLLRLAELLDARRAELALLDALDMGKPIHDALTIDAPAAARCFAWYGEAIDKVNGEITPTPADEIGMISREPVGVVGAIVPWNFPLLMAAWKIAPALATGNSVVLKPSEKSPLSALRLGELALEAGIPEGVFNVVPGFGHTAGEALALHADVDCIAFTGSTAVGKKMLEYAGRSNMKRVWLECGGKSPNLVLADCADLDAAAEAAAWGIFFNQGEMCSAASRLLAAREIKEPLLEKIVALGQTLRPADPLDPETRLGAIVDRIQFDKVLGYIEKGRAEGAELRLGGAPAGDEGFFVEPTVFDGVTPAMTIAREEIFGPVLSVLTFDDAADAVALANRTDYGLAAAVWTRDISKAHRIARALRAGTVWINCYDAGDLTVPFGGYKQSGNGRDKSLHALDKYVELKTTWIKL